MTSADRESICAYLERTKAELLETTATLNESQWSFRPAPEAWNAAECVEHLAITEAMLLGTIRKTPAAAAETLAQCAGKEQILKQKVPARGKKAQAPERVRPSGVSPADAVQQFIATRDRTIEFARTTEEPIRERVFPHFVFGPLDGYQWLVFCCAHTERHLAQLKEATAAEAQSRTTGSAL